MANRALHVDAAGTYTVVAAHDSDTQRRVPTIRLERVVVGSGDELASVTVRYADNDEVIAVIDAANPSVGQVFDLEVKGRGVEVVVAEDPDVTVLWTE